MVKSFALALLAAAIVVTASADQYGFPSQDSCSYNNPPVAKAGQNQYFNDENLHFEPIYVDASFSSDPDYDYLYYRWSFAQLPQGSVLSDRDIRGRATVAAEFTPDVTGVYALQVIVGDGCTSVPDIVHIYIKRDGCPFPPTSDAGENLDLVMFNLIPITLQGTGHSEDANIELSLKWTFSRVPAGSRLSDQDIMDSSTPSPNFLPDVWGKYRVRLEVSDSCSTTTSDVVVSILRSDCWGPPIVEVDSPTEIRQRAPEPVELKAVPSEGVPSNQLLHYIWSLTEAASGSKLTSSDIASSDKAAASFIPDVAGEYTFHLLVHNGCDKSEDTVTIQVLKTGCNDPPVADAGDDVSVTLDVLPQVFLGRDGAINEDHLKYQWSLVSKPPGSEVTSEDIDDVSSAVATFQPDKFGVYNFKFHVTDNCNDVYDNLRVQISSHLSQCGPPPKIEITDVPTSVGQEFAFDASKTVAEPSIVSSMWTFDSLPIGSELTDDAIKVESDNRLLASFTADVAGVYRVKFFVSDGCDSSEVVLERELARGDCDDGKCYRLSAQAGPVVVRFNATTEPSTANPSALEVDATLASRALRLNVTNVHGWGDESDLRKFFSNASEPCGVYQYDSTWWEEDVVKVYPYVCPTDRLIPASQYSTLEAPFVNSSSGVGSNGDETEGKAVWKIKVRARGSYYMWVKVSNADTIDDDALWIENAIGEHIQVDIPKRSESTWVKAHKFVFSQLGEKELVITSHNGTHFSSGAGRIQSIYLGGAHWPIEMDYIKECEVEPPTYRTEKVSKSVNMWFVDFQSRDDYDKALEFGRTNVDGKIEGLVPVVSEWDTTLTYRWELLSFPKGSNASSLGDIASAGEKLSLSIASKGEYTFRLTTSDGCLYDSSEVSVVVARDSCGCAGDDGKVTCGETPSLEGGVLSVKVNGDSSTFPTVRLKVEGSPVDESRGITVPANSASLTDSFDDALSVLDADRDGAISTSEFEADLQSLEYAKASDVASKWLGEAENYWASQKVIDGTSDNSTTNAQLEVEGEWQAAYVLLCRSFVPEGANGAAMTTEEIAAALNTTFSTSASADDVLTPLMTSTGAAPTYSVEDEANCVALIRAVRSWKSCGCIPASSEWTVKSTPDGSSIANGTAVGYGSSPRFRPDVAGDYTFTVVSSNGCEESTAEVVLGAELESCKLTEKCPYVELGNDQYFASILPFPPVTLEPYTFFDPDTQNEKLQLRWTFEMTPLGSKLGKGEFEHKEGYRVLFYPDSPGVYRVKLSISDGCWTYDSTVDYVIDQLEREDKQGGATLLSSEAVSHHENLQAPTVRGSEPASRNVNMNTTSVSAWIKLSVLAVLGVVGVLGMIRWKYSQRRIIPAAQEPFTTGSIAL